MGRMSKADRISAILRDNPALRRDDPRIAELIDAEAILRKAQRAARLAPVTIETGSGGVKRNPALVAVDSANTAVRRLRNELGIDRANVKRNEAAGVKVKRSPEAQKLIDLYTRDYFGDRNLLPGLAAFLSAHGITPEDFPEYSRGQFAEDLAEQAHLLDGIRDRIAR